MSGVSQVALIGLLAGVLLLVLALLAWQQARSRRVAGPVVYAVEDAVAFVTARLDGDVAERLTLADVRRILEWEIYYLQGLAQPDRRNPVETVAGGTEQAVAFIAAEIAEKHGVSYSPGDIAEVLRHEAEYLVAIGAVGEPVEPADPVDSTGGDEGAGESSERGEPR